MQHENDEQSHEGQPNGSEAQETETKEEVAEQPAAEAPPVDKNAGALDLIAECRETPQVMAPQKDVIKATLEAIEAEPETAEHVKEEIRKFLTEIDTLLVFDESLFTPESIADRFMNAKGRRALEKTVFPSEVKTVAVRNEDDGYGGAHLYQFIPCLGFHDGNTRYCIETNAQEGRQSTVDIMTLQFVQKNEDGTVTPGYQTEQLLIAMIDRTKKLNAKFPCPENDIIISALQQALFYHEKRVRDRMARGVMGDLKK